MGKEGRQRSTAHSVCVCVQEREEGRGLHLLGIGHSTGRMRFLPTAAECVIETNEMAEGSTVWNLIFL